MGRLTAGMTVRIIGTSDVGALVLVREATQTCVIKLTRDGALKKNVPLDDVEEARDEPPPIKSPICLAASDKPLALPPSVGGPSTSGSSPSKRSGSSPSKRGSTSQRLQVGDTIKARYNKGAKWFRGTITRVRSDGTYDVEYKDGDVETKVEDQYIEAAAPAAKTSSSLSPGKAARFAVGDRVKARYKKGAKLLAGNITKIHSDGTYDIRYDDGDVETRVEASYIQPREEDESETPREKVSSPKKEKGHAKPQVGDRVKARYKRGAKFYSGVITRVHADGTFDLKYEDGDTESRVDAAYIDFTESSASVQEDSGAGKATPKSFRVGDNVRANYKGGKKLYPGTIKRVHSDGTYDIKYEDGDVETRVEGDRIEEAAEMTGSARRPSSPKKTVSFSIGESIQARYKGGTKCFPGKIHKVRTNGTYDVKYDDGEIETGVEARHIEGVEPVSSRQVQESNLDVGDRVRARYKKGAKFFPGKIIKIHSDGSCDIKYDDGDTESRVQRDLIESATKPMSPSKASSKRDDRQPRVGEMVRARYKKGSKYYAGKITRVRTDGTFDIEYEDGDVETRVEAAHIEVAGTPQGDKPTSPKKKSGFVVGDAVLARYKKGAKLFRGTIKRVRSDGTYDVKYEDGDVETAVGVDYIEADQDQSPESNHGIAETFEEGDMVKAKYKTSSKWYPGRVSRVRTDGTYDIDYEDGEKETRVEANRIELITKCSSKTNKPKEHQAGDRVKAYYKDGKKLYDAVISRVRIDGTYDIKYDDDDTETRVRANMIVSSYTSHGSRVEVKRELRVGDHVIATHKMAKKLYRGVITRLRANGTCDIRYLKGNEEQQVPIDKVELDADDKNDGSEVDDDSVLATGDAVQAYFKKGKKLYTGKITCRHSDNTYDIRYDDGDVENRVARHLIVADPEKRRSKDDAHPKKLREGDVVMAKHKRSTKRVRGRISRARSDGTFDIEFRDGEVTTRVESDMIEKVDHSDGDDDDQRREKAKEVYEVGEKVKARYKNGAKWFGGKITKARTDGTYDIKYEDGDVEISVAPDLIQPIEKKTKNSKLDVGDEVSARYKNGSKWYNGVVKKVQTDGTFDVRYEDGDLEERVKPENVRATNAVEESPRGPSNGRRSPVTKTASYEKGDVVEADYKGKGRYRRASVLRVHGDDTIDVKFDNGDVEKRVALTSVRSAAENDNEGPTRPGKRLWSDSETESHKPRQHRRPSSESSSSSERPSKPKSAKQKVAKGTRVTMRKALDASARRIGRVRKTHGDGSCDIEYKNGDLVKRISRKALLVCSDGESSEEEANTSLKFNPRFKRDQAVSTCWRRATRMTKPTITDHWEDATVLSADDGGTYSIRYRKGDMEEDVPEEAIKLRPEHGFESRTSGPKDGSRELSDVDTGFLLEQLALTLYDEGQLSKKPRLRFAVGDHSSSSSSSDSESSGSGRSDGSLKKRSRTRPRDPIDKALRTLFDRKCLKRYQDRFDHHDPEQSGRIAKSKIIDVVEDLCSSGSSTKHAESTTVRKLLSEWFRSQDALRTHSKFDFKTLIVAHAVAAHHLSTLKIQQNMSNALEARFASHHESKKQLELWQQKIGYRTFETLQRFFHDCTIPRMYPARVRVSEIASIFDQVTRSAVPNKPLEVYLQQMQLRAHHTLQLAEFMCCYYQLYGSADTSRVPVWTEQFELRPIAFVASCLYSNGDPCCHRHGDLVRRLCIGRTPAQVDLIMRFREIFESLQVQDNSDGNPTISTSQLDAFAAKVVGDPSSLEQSVLALRKRTAAVSLVEIFSTCGFVIDELTSAPTVANAINKMRLRTETAEVRRVIGSVRNMCLKVLRFPNNPDFWRIRANSAAFHQKLGRFDGATSLIEAVGFIEYGKSHFELRGARTHEGNRASCLPKAILDTLREKCSELDAELSVIDGVESVVSILQRIAKQREHDTPLSLDECEDILKHLVVYVETVLKNPKDSRCWRIRESNKTFQRQVGYLPFCADLMASIGYDLASSSQGNVYVLRGTGLGSANSSGEKVAGKVVVNASLSNFAFSNVSQQMEWFLWRRKQEIESLLQDDMEYLVQMLAPSTSASTTRRPHNMFQRSAGTPATQAAGKMYPYGRNALDTFNKSESQKAQLAMMKTLFEALDKKKRGYLVAENLHVHCKLDTSWASFEMFDLDANGRVDFPDFAGALGPCLDYSFDPLSTSDFVSFQRMALSEQVSTLFGRIRLTVGRAEAARIVDTVVGFLVRIVEQPSKPELRTISDRAAIVAQSARVQPVKELLHLAGYRMPGRQTPSNDGDGVAFVLYPHQQVRFQTSKSSRVEVAPLDSQTLSRLQLIAAMLAGHGRVMMFPTISDIGALGRAIGERRPIAEWIKLLELTIMCLDNIVKHPEEEDRYRQLKMTTTTFSSVVSKVSGGVQLFLMIGFRETDRGTLLLPDDVGHDEIQARKLEISVGCEVLRIKEKFAHSREVDDALRPPASLRRSSSDGNSLSIDPAVDYYKRKALAAELAREEAVQKSVQFEKQLKIVASTQQLRRSLSSAPLTPSSKNRTQYSRRRDGRRREFH